MINKNTVPFGDGVITLYVSDDIPDGTMAIIGTRQEVEAVLRVEGDEVVIKIIERKPGSYARIFNMKPQSEAYNG